MAEKKLTVIIPTYNRADVLFMCLDSLQKQTLKREDFEIIVVNDGGTDKTEEVIENFQDKFVSLKYIYQENAGQGNARNNGIKQASGRIILFIGDDILLDRNALKYHVEMHEKHPGQNEAILGMIFWHPEIRITPFMEWLVKGKKGGHQFAFDLLEGQNIADYNFFYTSNISLKRKMLEKHEFDPVFKSYGWEDIELGYRLFKEEGLVLYFCSDAVGYHYHEIDEENLGKRMRSIGKSLWIFHNKYPELKKIPGKFKETVFWIISRKAFLKILKVISLDLYYYALSKKYFLEGLKEGLKQ